MRGKNKKTNGAMGEVAKGCAVCILTFLIISVILSFALFFSEDPTRYISVLSSIAFLFSAVISAIISSKLVKDGIFQSIIGCFVFLLLILFFALILVKGSVSGASLMNCLCYALIFLFCTFIFRKKKKTGHRKH